MPRCARRSSRSRAVAGVSLVAAVALAARAFWIEPARLVLREQELDVPNWPPPLAGLRLALTSERQWLPFLGQPSVPSSYGQRPAAGHVVEDGRQPFVTTGLGTSMLPVRLGVPPEVVPLTLPRARASGAVSASPSAVRPAGAARRATWLQ